MLPAEAVRPVGCAGTSKASAEAVLAPLGFAARMRMPFHVFRVRPDSVHVVVLAVLAENAVQPLP